MGNCRFHPEPPRVKAGGGLGSSSGLYEFKCCGETSDIYKVLNGSKSESVLFQLSVHILLYTNNSINFLLYGISSQKFRQQLSKMFFKSTKHVLCSKSKLCSSLRVQKINRNDTDF